MAREGSRADRRATHEHGACSGEAGQRRAGRRPYRSTQILRSKDLRLALLCFVVALVARVAFVVTFERPSMGFNDAKFYHLLARSLAEGRGYAREDGSATAQWPPGFSFVLSLLYRVTGAKPLAGELLNAGFGALTVPLLFVVARRAFDRGTAAAAALWLAVLPGPILWADMLFSETLYTFVVVGFLALLVVLPGRWWAVAVIGVAVGLAALVRGEGLFLALPALAYWYRQVPVRTVITRAAVLGVAMVATIAPWTIRNAVRLDTFAPVSSNVGATLWAGHNPAAYGGPTYYNDYERFGDDIVVREVDSSKYLRSQAVDYMTSHPSRELQLIPLKLLNLNRGDSEILVPLNSAAPGGSKPLTPIEEVRVKVVADIGYYSLLGLTLVSVAMLRRELWRRPITRAVLVLIITALVLYGFVYFGSYRYRFPLEPLMVLLAAPLLTGAWRHRRGLIDERTAPVRAG